MSQINKKVRKVTKLVTNIIPKLKLNLSRQWIRKLKSLIEMEHPLNMSPASPMSLAAKVHRAEEEFPTFMVNIK
jgi:hypothetical protein